MIKQGDIRAVAGEGMPQYKNPFEKGQLIVQFSVQFPQDNWLNAEKLQQIENLLPPRQEVIIPDGAEECTLHKFDPRQDGYSRQRRGEAYDSDEEDMHGPRVQCASH